MPVNVLGDDGSPVRNASVRARLVERPRRSLQHRSRTLQEWDLPTDETGACELAKLRLPNDPDLCRLRLDVAADGFVDYQRAIRLNRLISADGDLSSSHTAQLARGVAFTARAVGADGEPVPDARVTAIAMLREGNRVSGIHWFRPRTTGADGRFEIAVRPEMEIELTVYAAQWAPKRVAVPVGKRDAGDIQLEQGATVTGTFLDEEGKPAEGYWVVAESFGPGPSLITVSPLMVAAQTGPDGTFALPPLKGSWVLSTPASFQLWITEARQRSPQPRLVTLPQTLTLDGEDVELEVLAAPQVRIAGRVLDIDGTTAKNVRLRLNYTTPSPRVMFDSVVTDDNGRFAFEGIPSGAKGLMITTSALRRWKPDKQIYLKARPITHPEWQGGQGVVTVAKIDKDVLDLDFQFSFWSRKEGFIGGTDTKRAVQ